MVNVVLSKVLCSILCVIFTITSILPSAQAQALITPPGILPQTASLQVMDPLMLRGVTVDPANPLKFAFMVAQPENAVADAALKENSSRLIKYFLATLAVPNDHLWVNLSPYEKDRKMANDLAQTAMGMELLRQDLVLKQMMSSLLYPEQETGRAFWEKVYAEAFARFGTTDIPTDTFNKVWIMPEAASILEKDNTAWLLDFKLKVMLESDYIAARHSG